MFKVENADFIADKLASELLPSQEYREVYKNAEEAIERRIAANEATKGEQSRIRCRLAAIGETRGVADRLRR